MSNRKKIRGDITAVFVLVFVLAGAGYYAYHSFAAAGSWSVKNMVYSTGNCTSPSSCRGKIAISVVHSSNPSKVYTYKWDAFSGTGGSASLDPCYINHGIIPFTDAINPITGRRYTNNYYAVLRQYRNGGNVDGFSFELSQGSTSFADSRFNCGSTSITRSSLLIHSEMTPSQGQGNTEPSRWDGVNDYYSNGCIKISYRDMVEEGGAGSAGSVESLLRATGLLRDGLRIKLTVNP